MSHADLVDVYISGLELTAVAIVASPDGRRCRIRTGDLAPGEKIKHRYYFKASHAELVLATIGRAGLLGQSAAALAARIVQAATTLGAPFQTPDALHKAAAEAVAEVQARVNAMRQNGGMKEINRQYKAYRQGQIAKAEKAIPYSAYLQRYTAIVVAQVAASGRMI